jgi:hypothetical protein
MLGLLVKSAFSVDLCDLCDLCDLTESDLALPPALSPGDKYCDESGGAGLLFCIFV